MCRRARECSGPICDHLPRVAPSARKLKRRESSALRRRAAEWCGTANLAAQPPQATLAPMLISSASTMVLNR